MADGFSDRQLGELRAAIQAEGAELELISPRLGLVKSDAGTDALATKDYLTAAPGQYDAVLVPGGRASVNTMRLQGYPLAFLREAHRRSTPISATGEGMELLDSAGVPLSAIALTAGHSPL